MIILKKRARLTGNNKKEIRQKIEHLRPWYYSFDFGDGLTTGQGQDPRGKFEKVLRFVPDDLSGLSCIDLAANNGQFSMFLKDLGSERVVAVDIEEKVVKQGEFIADILGYDIEFRTSDIRKLTPGFDSFAYVFALGLIYHLHDMLGAIALLASITKKVCFIETEVLKIDKCDPNTALFIENRYGSDSSNWWIPGIQCVMSMCRSQGFVGIELIDYFEHREKVTREGLPFQARGLFRAYKPGVDQLIAPRLEKK